jgi:hypothetical protein
MKRSRIGRRRADRWRLVLGIAAGLALAALLAYTHGCESDRPTAPEIPDTVGSVPAPQPASQPAPTAVEPAGETGAAGPVTFDGQDCVGTLHNSATASPKFVDIKYTAPLDNGTEYFKFQVQVPAGGNLGVGSPESYFAQHYDDGCSFTGRVQCDFVGGVGSGGAYHVAGQFADVTFQSERKDCVCEPPYAGSLGNSPRLTFIAKDANTGLYVWRIQNPTEDNPISVKKSGTLIAGPFDVPVGTIGFFTLDYAIAGLHIEDCDGNTLHGTASSNETEKNFCEFATLQETECPCREGGPYPQESVLGERQDGPCPQQEFDAELCYAHKEGTQEIRYDCRESEYVDVCVQREVDCPESGCHISNQGGPGDTNFNLVLTNSPAHPRHSQAEGFCPGDLFDVCSCEAAKAAAEVCGDPAEGGFDCKDERN